MRVVVVVEYGRLLGWIERKENKRIRKFLAKRAKIRR